MAIHRGRIDLLEACFAREPEIVYRQFGETMFYPVELDITPGDGLHCAPLDGGTLLHMAIEYHELEIAQWLIDHGGDVNARAAVDADGFGGHTPLFHTTVTLVLKADTLARLLLRHGADPSLRATIRKALRWEGDQEKVRMCEFHDVTAIGFASQFQEPQWVNDAAIATIREYGGE
jgi:ankyrin repeat protein